MKTTSFAGLTVVLSFIPFFTYAENVPSSPARAILLTPVSGHISSSAPQPVVMEVVKGDAKGCLIRGTAHLNLKRLRYEYRIQPTECQDAQGQPVKVGRVVRGQHNIKGTMANSGMGRDYLLSKKGLEVTLSDH